MRIDKLDQKILAELERNARVTNSEIASKLKISEGTVRNRIQALVKSGIIKRFTIDLGTREGFSAIVMIKSKPQLQTALIVERLKIVKGVKKIFETAGEFDIILEVTTESAESFNEIIEKIRSLRGILETRSLTILNVN